MLRARLISKEKFNVVEEETPVPMDDEVLLRVIACGVCGSDLHAYKGELPGVGFPLDLGHEIVGQVEKIGRRVVQEDLLGKRVIVQPNIACRSCTNCMRNRANICSNLKVIGFQVPGGFAEYIRVSAEKVICLPDELPASEAILIEPTAAAVHAMRKMAADNSGRAVVLGAGTVGALLLQALKDTAQCAVAVVETSKERARLARSFGADLVIDNTQEAAEKLKSWASSDLMVVFDCVGVRATVELGIESLGKGGKLILLGISKERASINTNMIQDRELELIGSQMYTRTDFTSAVNLIEKGRLAIRTIPERSFPLEQINDAFHFALSDMSVLKVWVDTGSH